jgi:hypothetical protein
MHDELDTTATLSLFWVKPTVRTQSSLVRPSLEAEYVGYANQVAYILKCTVCRPVMFISEGRKFRCVLAYQVHSYLGEKEWNLLQIKFHVRTVI